jgi:sRNA-binding regulator protein Hfq
VCYAARKRQVRHSIFLIGVVQVRGKVLSA